MQVSWIDADEVRELVELLAEPPAPVESSAPDLDTLPESLDRYGFEFLGGKPAAASLSAGSVPPEEPSTAADIALQPDVSEIRERLRAIRDRAQEAGLLTKESPAPPPPPAPAPFAPSPVEAATDSSSVPSQPANPPPPESADAAPPASPEPAELTSPAEPAPAITPEESPLAQQGAHDLTLAERLDDFARSSSKLTTSEELFMLDDHGELLWGTPTSDDLLICAKLALNATMRSHAATLAPATLAAPVHVGPGKELQLVTCPTRHGNVTLALVNAAQVPTTSLQESLTLTMNG